MISFFRSLRQSIQTRAVEPPGYHVFHPEELYEYMRRNQFVVEMLESGDYRATLERGFGRFYRLYWRPGAGCLEIHVQNFGNHSTTTASGLSPDYAETVQVAFGRLVLSKKTSCHDD